MIIEYSLARWLALLILAIVLLFIAVYGWRLGPTTVLNRRFAIQTLVVTWWVTGVAGAHGMVALELWGKWAFGAAALMPVTFLKFAEAFPSKDHRVPRALSWITQAFAAGLVVVIATTPWVAHSYGVTPGGALIRTPGPLMWLFAAYFAAACALMLGILLRKWRVARGVPRAQLRLYFIGCLLFCLGGLLTNLLLPQLVGDSRYSALGPCFVLVFLAFVAHGIMRHRFMNLRFVIHNWLVVGLASVASVVPLLIIATHAEPALRGAKHGNRASSIALLVAAGLLAPPLWLSTHRLLQRLGSKAYARFRILVSDASERLAQVLTQSESATVVCDTIRKAVDPEGVAVYAYRVRDEAMKLVHCSDAHVGFGVPGVLPPVVVAELGNSPLLASEQAVPIDGRELSTEASDVLRANEWALVIALVAERDVIGAVAVGAKRSAAPYYLEDIRLFQILASQAAVAFKNGQLYERVTLANQYIENIVASVDSGIIAVDHRHNVRIINDAALSLLGLRAPMAASDVDPSRIPHAVMGILTETLKSGRASYTADMTICRGEQEVTVMVSAAPLRTLNLEIIGAVATLSDLSTIKALERERTRAERLDYFETLAAALAHEIANPIAPIKVMTQLLSERPGNTTFVAEFTRTVTREIGRIEKLVARLRALSRPSLIEVADVDVRGALRDATDTMRAMLESQNITLSVHISDIPLIVAGDLSELQELFLNLLTNAVEATPRGGRISVIASRNENDARVTVKDSGAGISDAIAEQIFRPFTSTKGRGSGLGLAICEGIVRRHHGTIAVTAGVGAEFTVQLPLLREAMASRPETLRT